MNPYAATKKAKLRLSTTEQQKATVEALAKARRISTSEVVRRALDSYVAKGVSAIPTGTDDYIAALTAGTQRDIDAIVASLESLHHRIAALEPEAS